MTEFVRVKLDRKNNARRIYLEWWDIVNLSVGVLVIVVCFIAFSLTLLGVIKSDLVSNLVPMGPKSVEMGINILGLTVSGGSAAALWIIGKGIKRWSIIRRIYFLHRYAFKEISYFLRDDQLDEIEKQRLASSLNHYYDAAGAHFENINYCHPMCQKYFEELRMLITTEDLATKIDVKTAYDIAFRLFAIALLSVGKIRGFGIDLSVARKVADELKLKHRVDVHFI